MGVVGMNLLHIDQKKGNPASLDGRLTVYAFVDVEPSEIASSNHPLISMVHNGLLVAQGNYREQTSFKDFLKSELGESVEDGLEAFLEKLDGLEGALDPDKLREKLKNIDDLKDFIPTPAKIVPFHSEADILQQDGDIFCIGKFENLANANLGINSFPIFYQARYRELEVHMIRNEIDLLVSQIEKVEFSGEHYLNPGVNIEQKIVKDYIPILMYARRDKNSFEITSKKLRKFMQGYKFSADIDSIISVIEKPDRLLPQHYKLIELYIQKITEVCKENYSQVDALNREISEIENRLKTD